MPAGDPPPHDLEAEVALLGALLVAEATPKLIDTLRMEIGLRGEHFYRRRNQLVWEAVAAVVDAEARADTVLVAAWMREHGTLKEAGGLAGLNALPSVAFAPGNAVHYAKQIIREWRWRRARESANAQLEAIAARDEDALHAAVAAGDTTTRASARHTDPKVLGEVMLARAQEDKPPPLPSPWAGLARQGLRLRLGQTTVLAAWSHHGKTMVALELADHVGREGLHAVFWTNEMSEDELVARQVQRMTGIDANRILDGELDAEEEAVYRSALGELPFGVQECFGWPGEEIARHIRVTAPALAILDHFHQMPGSTRNEDAEPAVVALTSAARQAGTHLIIVSQLNRGRDLQGEKPPPTQRDLRSTAALESLPNNILFWHRDQQQMVDEEGDPVEPERWEVLNTATMHVAKQRMGHSDFLQPMVFGPDRLSIRERAFGT